LKAQSAAAVPCRARLDSRLAIALLDIKVEVMADTAQDRALKNYRKRLQQRGLARFEVLGLAADRKLIRALAKRLAESGPQSQRLRATVSQVFSEEGSRRGGIFAALRRSPMVGAGIKFKRERTLGRKVDL
jgi:hypothetical protein